MSKEEMVRTVFCQAKSGNYIAHQDHVTCEVCAPSAANKAAEEGGLPLDLMKQVIRDALGNTHIEDGTVIAFDQVVDELAIAVLGADRASRQVANKAEVEPVAHLYKWIGDANDSYEGRVVARSVAELKGEIDIYPDSWERIGPLYATPPSTTGASTVLTDERMRTLYEAWEMAEAERRKGEPLDNDERSYVVKRCPGASDTYNIAPAAWPAFKAGCEVAAQAGHSNLLLEQRNQTLDELQRAHEEIKRLKAQAGQVAVPELMRQAVATVVSRAGDNLRIGWLRPERCDVGTLLYCASPSPAKESK